MKKLYKSTNDKRICGVCGGLAEYLNIDATLIRIIATVLFFAGSLSFWVYIIAAIIIPEAPKGYYNDDIYYNGGQGTDATAENEDSDGFYNNN